MNGFNKFSFLIPKEILIFILTSFFVHSAGIFAQNNSSLTGAVFDKKSNEPVPYAGIGLYIATDSALFHGTISDENGNFIFSPAPQGNFTLKISVLGYKLLNKSIDIKTSGRTDVGTLFLEDSIIMIQETVVKANSIKAKSEGGRTGYFITKKMIDASATGTDILRLVPGIQVDLRQNISLEGSSNILILVDGRERDMNFISQLNPGQIQKVEILSAPPANMDGNITGAINIILKKEREAGFSGQVVADIPASERFTYLFPTYSLHYGFKKLNIFASYNGEIDRENINESNVREVWGLNDTNRLSSNQYVRQKNTFHRFHFGFDYFIGEKDLINFYGYYNPYSYEQDGRAVTRITGDMNNDWIAGKEDTDKNRAAFYSLFYKHIFDKRGREITFDLSRSSLNAENSTVFFEEGTGNTSIIQSNTMEPDQQAVSFKTDFLTFIGSRWNFGTGAKIKYQVMRDKLLEDFSYNEKVLASYGTLSFKNNNFDAGAGLRLENSISEINDNSVKPFLYLLPNLTFRYNLSNSQNLNFNYSRSVNRPNLYQMNPSTSISDPYTVFKGNPSLAPEVRSALFLEYSVQFKGNFVSSRLYYNNTSAAISNLVFVNDTGAFEIQKQNLGSIRQFGIQLTGTYKLGIVTLNPYIRFYNAHTYANGLAKKYLIQNRQSLDIESGLSALLSFKKDIALSLIFQYATPKDYMQEITFSDPLYILSIDKTFKGKLKAGLVCAIPLKKSMVYRGSEIKASDFYYQYKGILEVPAFPVWFRLSYQFNTGAKRDKINRTQEEFNSNPRKSL